VALRESRHSDRCALAVHDSMDSPLGGEPLRQDVERLGRGSAARLCADHVDAVLLAARDHGAELRMKAGSTLTAEEDGMRAAAARVGRCNRGRRAGDRWRPARWLLIGLAVAFVGIEAVASAGADVIRLSHGQLEALGGAAQGRAAALSRSARGAPSVATGQAVDETKNSATLTASVNPNGRRTTYRFEYGTTTAYGSRAPVPDAAVGRDRTTHRVHTGIGGLAPATIYHFRVVARNRRGTTFGRDVMFLTPAATYTNPVYGTFPDPMAALTGADYYAYGTGDNFPILHSTDLVHWASVGTAFTGSTFPSWSTGNPWAPSVLAMPVTTGRPACPGFDLAPGATCFYRYYTGRSALPGGPNCVGVATSDRPDGGLIDQGVLSNGTLTSRGEVGCGDAAGYSNIDPAPFIDADGQAYLLYQTGRNAAGAIASTISVIELAADLVHAIGSRRGADHRHTAVGTAGSGQDRRGAWAAPAPIPLLPLLLRG
jgi:hypothetical protein